jgi:hypothetical protein
MPKVRQKNRVQPCFLARLARPHPITTHLLNREGHGVRGPPSIASERGGLGVSYGNHVHTRALNPAEGE